MFERQVVPALASLVVRQARRALLPSGERSMVCGTDAGKGRALGLMPEDRRAMAMVSRAVLAHRRADWLEEDIDFGAEIHLLLYQCTKPLGDWLPRACVDPHGCSAVTLIDGEGGEPTADAQELAQGFGDQTSNLESLVFERWLGELRASAAGNDARRHSYYSTAREFVVRHPLATHDDFQSIWGRLPGGLVEFLRAEFYEAVPAGWAADGVVPRCAHCGDALRRSGGSWSCGIVSCRHVHALQRGVPTKCEDVFRAQRWVRRYWIEPGIDEVRIYDALQERGLSPVLYPYSDRVDIEVGDKQIGIDLKMYASPEVLGARLKRDIGGLALYHRRYLVIPDWLITQIPSYLERLRDALEDSASEIRCIGTSAVLAEIAGA